MLAAQVHFWVGLQLLLPMVYGRCCEANKFCGAIDNSTCFDSTCDNLLKEVCGVPTCCSCQTSSTDEGCEYKVCTSGRAMCVEVQAERTGGAERAFAEGDSPHRISTVLCDGVFPVRLDEKCHALHTDFVGSITIGLPSSHCLDDGSEICQAVWSAPPTPPTPLPYSIEGIGTALYSLFNLDKPSTHAAHAAGVGIIGATMVICLLLAVLVRCCCCTRSRTPIIKTMPRVQLDQAVANRGGAIVTG
uniref:Uncharacterized protein n=1 Tax=Coccolithus braarudii TaxID=221442 RepID=A0A7S0LHD1_9EUKA|mmetsp:Transcript_40398/g.86126  ORF Transcript_40398/g.86126 Transcript_40398/m.86126 type:complete len:246 (+) Transcript_40398:27-764(+)